MTMVQKTFGIYGEAADACQLTVEAGKDYIACVQKIMDSGKVTGFELFQFDKTAGEEFASQFTNIKKQSKLLDAPFAEVQIVWANEHCIGMPNIYYDEKMAGDALTLAFGSLYPTLNRQEMIGDKIMLYQAPKYQYVLLNEMFPAALATHKYYLMLKEWATTERAADSMRLLFYREHFILMAMKENNLQLINSFSYQTPEDAVYQILNACARLGMEKEKVHYYFSGLLDVNSSLYKELSLYLLNIHLSASPAEMLSAEGFGEYPAHYFSSFINSYA